MKTNKVKLPNRIEYRNEQGKLHREDGPAIEWKDGGKSWYLNNKIHREDGPAVEYNNGQVSWYLNDERFRTEETWFQELTKIKLKRILDL